ncbi:MAG: beta strand repeat-containing protein, partial [Bacteriovoracaceae bacterium]
TFSPSSTGTCTITADAGGGITDTTGAISSSNGTATSFSITLLGGGTTTTAGENFGLRITALDADGNRAFDYSPATTYTITSTLTNSPEGTAPDTWSVSSSDFVFGEAIIFPVKAYNAQTFTVTVTETVGGAGLASTSATLTNQANSLNHYATSSGSGTYTADGVTTFSFTVEARDEYGNATTTGITSNTVNAVTPVYSSGDEATVGSFSGFTSFTFGGGSATETISGLTYDISHEVEVVVSDSAGVTTKSGERLAIEFDPSPSSISSYEIFNISDTTPDAGDTITAQIRALDSAGNVVTDSTDESIDNALEGYTFTVTFGSSANNSDYGDSPTSSGLGSLTFTEGVSSTFNLAFYNDETVLGTDIDIDDGNSRVGDAGSNDITVSTASLDHYSNNATAPASIDGDGTSTFTATINARDAYGNIVTGDSSITLTPVAQDSHTVGILGGTKTLNMASGTTTVTDLTYNASGTLKLGSTGGTASIDTATAGRSTVYSFDSVAGTVDSYLVEILDGANPTAGDSTYRIRLTAKDSSDNTIDDDSVDATLSARTFTISGFSASPEGTAFSPAAGFVWSSEVTTGNESDFTDGVAVLEITPVAAETITSFTVTDSSSISGTYSGSITIDPATFSKVVIAGASSGTADGNDASPTDYTATVTGRDTYGNVTTAPGATGYTALVLDTTRINGVGNTGTVSSTPATIDLTTNATTVVSVNYNVAHSTRFKFTDAGATALIDSSLTPIVTWSMDASVVNSYTLVPTSSTGTAGSDSTFRLTAFDAGGNQIVGEDTILDTISFDFSSSGTNCDAPNTSDSGYVAQLNGSDLSSANAVTATSLGGFSNGIIDFPVTFYNTQASCGAVGFLDFTDTTNSVAGSNGSAITIEAATKYYATTAVSGFPQNADDTRVNTTSLTITLYDEYGNEKEDSTESGTFLSLQKISGYGVSTGILKACGPTGGGAAANYGDTCITPIDVTTINLDFSSSATQTLYDLSYDVGHTIEVRYDNSSGVTTQASIAADAENFSFTTTTGTVVSYTFVNPTGPITSGTSDTWTITALDSAGNTITGSDSVLDTLSLSITDNTAGDFDAPDGGDSLQISIGGFSTGEADATITIYSSEDVENSDFTLVDSTNTINTNNTGGTVTVNSVGDCDRFTAETTNLGSSPDADGVRLNSTEVLLTCVDAYGNATSYAGGNNIKVDFVHVSDAQAYGANTGTLKACSPSAGNGCGTPVDVTTLTLDFSSPTTTQTLYDLSYDVGHDIYVRAYEDGGSVTTASGDSDLIEWEAVAGTIASYTLTPVSGSTNAGNVTSWEIRAFDIASNQMTNENGLNDTILSARSYSVVETAAGSGNMDGPTSGTVDLPSGASVTFSSGVATLSGADGLTFYNSDNDVPTNYLELQDDLSNTGTLPSGMTIDPEGIGASFGVSTTGTFPGDASNDNTTDGDTEITITLYDQYGNATTDSTVTNATITPSITTSDANYTTLGNLEACGPDSADANNGDGCSTPLVYTSLSYDFTSSTTQVLSDLSYTAPHDIQFFLSSTARSGISTASGDSDSIQWSAGSKVIDSYTLTFDSLNATAGASTNLTLSAYDAAGNLVDQAGEDSTLDAITFNFTATAANDAPTSADTVADNDPADGSSFNFSSGQATVPYIFFADRVVLGTADEITITDNNGVSVTPDNSDSIDVDPATATQLVFTTSALTETAGVCSGAVTIQTRDPYGNPSTVGSNLSVTLAGDSGTMSFFSDSGCSSSIGTTATVTSGTHTSTFYYTDTSEGTTNISLSSSLTDPSDQAHTIQANTAVQIAFTTSAQTVAAGDCSAVVTVEARDTYGNDSEVGSNTNITLAGDSGTMTFFSDSGCSTGIGTTATITSGTDEVSFYYKDTSEGTTNLSLSSSLTDPSDQAQTIQANTAVQLAFTTSAQTVTAGDCSGVVTVESQDTHGNDSEVGSNTNITLAGDSGTMTFFSDSGCSTGIGTTATITSGTDEVSFYYKDTSEGTTNLSLSSSLTDPSNQAQTIQANTAVQIAFTTSAQTVAAGDCS